jgi:hypothetical protein
MWLPCGRKRTLLILCFLLSISRHYATGASINSNTATINLSATLGSSLTVSTGSPTIHFTLTNCATSNGDASAPITTSWVLLSTNSSVKLYAYFSSSTSALSDAASDLIPSSDVLGSVTSTGGSSASPTTSLTAFSQTGPSGFGIAGSSLLLDTYTITSANFVNLSGVIDTLSLAIATPSTLPAGVYSGVITIEAQAN